VRLISRIGALAAAAVMTVTAGLTIGRPAFAANPDPIISLNSGMCLQPAPTGLQSITDNGVRIAQLPCTGRSEQRWHSVPVGDDDGQTLYYLINNLSGKCLDVTNASSSDRASIQQYTCNDGGSEKWIVQPYVIGGFQYTNSRTDKCLDNRGASNLSVYIWQYRCTTLNSAQAFTFPS
jgi:hypothetical protein